MSRKKNLLEAFQRSESARTAAGPGHAPAEAGASSPMPLFESPAASARGALQGIRPWLALGLLVLVLVFALGYGLGRGSRPEALAKDPGSPGVAGGAQSEPESAALASPASQPRSFQERLAPSSAGTDPASAPAAGTPKLEESALYDRANVCTVVVAAYSATKESNRDLAWATYEHLLEAGLPVFPPVASKNLFVVLVGAAPREAELGATKDAVRALQRDGKSAYADAYVARIDTLIPRPTTKGSQSP